MNLIDKIKSVFSYKYLNYESQMNPPFVISGYSPLNLAGESPQFYKVYNECKPKHPQYQLYSPIFEENISVDAGIAELIRLLWEEDIITYNSCQENKPGYIWIEFATPDDALKFTNTILKPIFKREDWDHKNWLSSRLTDHTLPFGWKYDVCINDNGSVVGDEYIEKLPMDISISIRFPISDYNTVISLFKQGRLLPDTW